MSRWLVVVVLLVPILVVGAAGAEWLGIRPVWVVLPLVLVIGWALAPLIAGPIRLSDRDGVDAFKDDLRDRPAPRKASSRDPALRPVTRLSGSDPLDPIFGAQAAFPADPDLGQENAHHVVIDPKELGDPAGERLGSGREEP